MKAHIESVRAAESVKLAAAKAAKAGAHGERGEREQETEKTCPTCGRELAASNAFCPHDGTPLSSTAKPDLLPFAGTPGVGGGAAAPGNAPLAAATPLSRGKICPTCGERFEGAADYCGKDGTHLVLLN
jgi:hypothetical protein